MDITIHLSGPTVKQLTHLLHIAFRGGDRRSIKRITALIQDLIEREFQRCYNVHEQAELLGSLGFSYQKARFISDHLDQEQRQRWL